MLREEEDEHEAEGGEANIAVMGVVSLLVLLGVGFEAVKARLEKTTTESNLPVISAVFSELTLLGFIGLLLFLVQKAKALESGPLEGLDLSTELIETIHMGLFLFMLIYLLIVALMLRLSATVVSEWRRFERSVRALDRTVEECNAVLSDPGASRAAAGRAVRHLHYLGRRQRFVAIITARGREQKSLFDPQPTPATVADGQRQPLLGSAGAPRAGSRPHITRVNTPRTAAAGGDFIDGMVDDDYDDDDASSVASSAASSVVSGEDPLAGIEGGGHHRRGHSAALHHVAKLAALEAGGNTGAQQLQRQRKALELVDGTEGVHAGRTEADGLFDFAGYLDLILGETLGEFAEVSMHTWLALEVVMVLMWGALEAAGEPALLAFGYVLLAAFACLSLGVTRLNDEVTPNDLVGSGGSSGYGACLGPLFMSFVPPYLQRAAPERPRRWFRWLGPFGYGLASSADLAYWFYQEPEEDEGWVPGPEGLLFTIRLLLLNAASWVAVFLVAYASTERSAWVWVAYAVPLVGVFAVGFDLVRRAVLICHVERLRDSEQVRSVLRTQRTRRSFAIMKLVSSMRAHLVRSVAVSERRGSLFGNNSGGQSRHRRGSFAEREERQEIDDLFSIFDLDNTGSLSRDEIRRMLLLLNWDASQQELEQIFAELDADGDNSIDKNEFRRWMRSHLAVNETCHEEVARSVFAMLDCDGDGSISVDEFVHTFEVLGQQLDHEDIRELMLKADRDGDGSIDEAEFRLMWRRFE